MSLVKAGQCYYCTQTMVYLVFHMYVCPLIKVTLLIGAWGHVGAGTYVGWVGYCPEPLTGFNWLTCGLGGLLPRTGICAYKLCYLTHLVNGNLLT